MNNRFEFVISETGEKFSFTPSLKENLDVALHAVKNCDQDLCIVFDGHEGAGKSKASRQIGYYCAKILGSKFDIDSTYNIHNDLDSYVDSCNVNGKYYVSILDEGRSVVNSKRSLSKDAQRFTNFLSECRSNNQVHIIILPAFNDLDRYIAQWRMSILINMRKLWVLDKKVELGGHRLVLGNYRGFVNDDNLRKIYDRKQFMYPKTPAFSGVFENVEVMSDKGLEAYTLQKSEKMIEKYGSSEEEKLAAKLAKEKELAEKKPLTIKDMYNLDKKHVNAYRYSLYRHFCKVAFKYYEPKTTRLTVDTNFLMDLFELPLHVINRSSFKRPHIVDGDVDPMVFVGSNLVPLIDDNTNI